MKKKLSILTTAAIIVALVCIYIDSTTLNKDEHIALFNHKDNGYLLFIEAGKMLNEVPPELEDELYDLENAKTISDELRAHLDSNRPAVDKLCEGLAMPYCIAPFQVAFGPNAPSEQQTSHTFHAGKELIYQTYLEGIDGNFDQAFLNNLALLNLGQRISNGGNIISGLIGISSFQLNGTKHLTNQLNDLTSPQLKEVISTLESVEQNLISFKELVANEEYMIYEYIPLSNRLPYWYITRNENPYKDDLKEKLFLRRNTEMVQLALQARIELYTRQHGKVPEHLADVMDGKSIPIDPFSQKPFDYKDGQAHSSGLEDYIKEREEMKNQGQKSESP